MELSTNEINLLLDACENTEGYTQECLWECEDDGRKEGAQKNRDRLEALTAIQVKLAEAL